MRWLWIGTMLVGCASPPGDGMWVQAQVDDASADFTCASSALDQAAFVNGQATVQCSDSQATNYGYLNLSGIDDAGLSLGTFDLQDTDGMGLSAVAFTVQIGGSFGSPSATFSSYDNDQVGTIQIYEGLEAGVLSIRLDLDDPDGGTALVEVSTTLD